MALVAGYSSSSESESDRGSESSNRKTSTSYEQKVDGTAKVQSKSLKKRKHVSPILASSKRKLKRRKSPWDSLSEDDSECRTESSNESLDDTDTVSELQGYQELEHIDDKNVNIQETSHFYGESEKDYQGRGFLHPPAEVDTDLTKDPMSFKCYLPKRIIHTFAGHTHGTNSIEFLPKSGHLFLSGGNDSLVRIWDFYHGRKCLRDYKGHTRPVKVINFTNDGTKFISAAFDQSVKLWNTESGKVISRLKFSSIPNDVKTHPTNPNEFIVGCSNSKIYHYDTRIDANKGRVQVYDHHLSSILNLRYFPDGSKFISSSEDKTVRIWENQINIPIKQISDTAQHSMPYIDTHPAAHYFCTQSMDNTIYTYGMKPKYKRHPKKTFNGQISAGYGIGLAFSPDGRYICSGDSKSRVMIWDWTTTNLLKTVSIPGNEPVTKVAWNPQETSKLICSGPTGKIYLLD